MGQFGSSHRDRVWCVHLSGLEVSEEVRGAGCESWMENLCTLRAELKKSNSFFVRFFF